MTLAAFRVRSYRFQWPADLLTSWASEMETLILGWYVMVHTGSVLWLTGFGALQFLGTLAAPMFGVLGDRLGGRIMLCAMRSTYVLLASLLTALALAGLLTPTWVLVSAALAGLVRSNDLVMRNALIGETIPPAHLMGALGMSRATQDSARVAGALAGAALSTVLGIGYTYLFVTSFYVASLLLTLGVARRRPVPDPSAAPRAASAGVAAAVAPRSSHRSELKEGLVLVLRTPELLAMMLLAFLVNLTAYPISSGLLPYVVKNIYMVDAAGLGWLVAAFSVGGLLGAITVVTTGGPRRPERSMLVHVVIWYVLLAAFGHVRTLGAGVVLLLLAGFVQNVAMIAMARSLLAAAGDRFRGRVMGVRTLAVYGMLPGLLGAGALIERIGYPLTVTVATSLGLVGTILIAVRWRASIWHGPRRPAVATSAIAGLALFVLTSVAMATEVTGTLR